MKIKSARRPLLGGATAALVLAAVVTLTHPPSHARAATAATVRIDNFTFVPATLTVPVGTTVTWRNDDDIPHLVVANSKSFRSPALDTGDTFSFTFATAGSYDYFCGLHPHMQGSITVTP